MYRNTYALIDKDIIKNNVKEITTKYNDYQYYIGVVKNNAYSHGIDIIPSLIEGGVNYLAVSSLDEAMKIRESYKNIPILILEPIDLKFIPVVQKNKITITVESLPYLEELLNSKINKNLKVHFKIDSGMNRLGFKEKKDIEEAYLLINKDKYLELEGIYTHFATAGRGDSFYKEQLDKVLYLLSGINLESVPIVHFDRSLTFVSHEKIKCVNGIRLGVIMYGFSGSVKPSLSFKSKLKRKLLKKPTFDFISENDLNLKTAFSLYSSVIAIRKVEALEHVGYNASYVMDSPGYIATIAIGYADGVTKDYREVAINNKRYEIVSDSMDMIMVKVDESVKVGDTVEIFGDNISINETKRRLKINGYHLFNMITSRVPRIYKEEK